METAQLMDLSLREVLAGRIVILKEALQLLQALDPIRRETLRVLAETVSLPAAGHVERHGLEQLHTVLTTTQATRMRTTLETRLRPLADRMTAAFLDKLPPQGPPIYLCKHFGVRVMMPRDAVAAGEAELAGLQGFMTPRSAHVDSWFNTGVNSVNLWVAISRVRRGNGLLVFPEVYGRYVRGHDTEVDPDAHIGAPTNFEMEAGDILVFASDHLHASEQNVTDETRYVLTKRISLGPPRYNPQGNSWVPYYDTRLLGSPLEPLASLRSRLSSSYAKSAFQSAHRSFTRNPS